MTDTDRAGATLAGKYRIKRRIGAGGMGAVYEGENIAIKKRVAIKLIEHQHANHPELAKRFQREAEAASAVESEHIVQVFDVGHDPDLGLYMVMEKLTGEDLSSRIEKGGKLPVEEATTILLQAARALAKAHAAGVVHRDLKPANLFLTAREDGSVCVKILDFGISKLQRPEQAANASSSLTREGMVIGTPQYMSPEQAQGIIVDARSDVWSLGAVAYELYAGRPAFEPRDTYEQMIIQIVTQKPKPLRDVAPWVPPSIAALVEEALVHDVKARLADCGSFAKRLAEAAKMPAAANTSSPDIAYAPTALGVPTPAAQMRAAPAATNAGVVVATGSSTRSSPKLMIGVLAGIFGLGALIGVGVLLQHKPDDGAKSATGMVQAHTPEPPAASPPARAIPPPPAVDVPPPVLASASAPPSPPPVVLAKPPVVTPKAPPRPPAPPPVPTDKPAPASTRLGDPGLSNW